MKKQFFCKLCTRWGRGVLAFLLVLVVYSVQAQTVQVKGTVKDAESALPIPGATVNVKGTQTYVLSDFDGMFSIDIDAPAEGKILVISFVGYKSTEIAVGEASSYDVSLQPNTDLDEIVVIGYDTQKRGEVTSSIVSVKEKDFTTGASRDAGDLIRGKVAGLSITNTSGDPTAEAIISLRGVSSLRGNSTPLVLINGIPGNLNDISPEEIESIDVLKDASAAAIYGTRGANGVIIITTKSAERDVPIKVTYSPYIAFSNFVKKADFCTASDMRNFISQGYEFPFEDEGYDTDWLSEITRTGFTHNHNINLSGGTSRASYAANISYNKTNGTFKKSNNEELKASFDMNQFMFEDKLKININVIKGSQKYGALGDGYSIDTRIYRNALIRNPTSPIKDADGNWDEELTGFQYYNPVAWVEETDGIIKNDWTRLTSNITLTPIEGWATNLMLSTKHWDQFRGYSESKQHWSNTFNGKNGFASRGDASTVTNYLDLTSKYSKIIGKHNFNALVGYSYQYEVNEGGWASNYNFPTDAFSYNDLSAGYALEDGKASMGSYKNDNTLVGFFGRVSYGFDNRYNFLASIRREGSSKVGENNKWGSFPSISAGWTISNESFMKDISAINLLKLRVGYGVTGIIPSESYNSLTLLEYSGYFYNGESWVKALNATTNPNPDLRWEKSTEINIGVDFALFNNRISGAVDLYKKNTTDLLWEYSVPVPPNLYNYTLANVGEMENKGIEIALNTTPVRTANIEWNSNFTFSHNKNELISLSNDLYEVENEYLDAGGISDPISMSTHRLEPGKPIGNFWGMRSVDITEDGQWIIESADGTREVLIPEMYNDDHKQYLGNGIPKYNLSWINNFRYKGFELSMIIRGAFGFQILNHQRMFYENPNIEYNRLTSAYDLVYGKAVLDYFQQTYVSYYLEDGDYVKLDNLTLGYNFNLRNVKYIKSLRLYASCSNLLTITGYKGLDPEIYDYDDPDDYTDGLLGAGNDDRDKYPSLRTFTFGLNVTF